MIKILISLALLVNLSTAKNITPNEVYSQVMLVTDEVHYLFEYFGIKHDHDGIIKRTKISTRMMPRNTWQITYEIMVKINILREEYNLPIIEPINMMPVLELNAELVYEQTQRVLSEIHILKYRLGIESPKFKVKKFKRKTPLDVFNSLVHISISFDELNKGILTPSHVFSENMRLYDDITDILQTLEIKDKTIPRKKVIGQTPAMVFDIGMNTLEKIKQLQIGAGIGFVDFKEFKKGNESPSEVYTITQMIIAELQTIKAYLKIDSITPAATKYNTKTPAEVGQLMSWNLRKLNLIRSLNKRR